jgi:GDP-D-mannose 3', 5'-epimerase
MWGDGKQTRSFTYIDDCVEGILRLTKSDFAEPVNLGSDEMVSMNEMQTMTLKCGRGRKRCLLSTSPAQKACAGGTRTTT